MCPFSTNFQHVHDVIRVLFRKGLEIESDDLEVDPLLDWEPVKFDEFRGDRVELEFFVMSLAAVR